MPLAKPQSKLDTLQFWLGRLAAIMAVISSISLVLLVVATGVSVIWRYFLKDPIFGIEDISTMLLSVTVAGAIAYGGINGSHVNVNLISYFAGRKLTRFTDAIVRLLGAMISGYAGYALFIKGSCGDACGNFTPNMAISHQPFYYLLGMALFLYAAVLLVHFLAGLSHFNASEDPNTLAD